MSLRKSFIGGNWKMNGSQASIHALLEAILKTYSSSNSIEVVVFPPFVYLQQVIQLIRESGIECGAQNLSAEEKGAFTGEISADMLKDIGCHSVLVGHSERRRLYGENNQIVAQKFARACKAGLQPVLCLGETLEERNQGIAKNIIKKQLETVFALPGGMKNFQKAVIAYEPVWAIGTGVNATAEQAQEIHQFIRELVKKNDENIANTLRIIYGGSVKASNAKDLFEMPDIDGGLIGGASLDPKEFVEIINTCKH